MKFLSPYHIHVKFEDVCCTLEYPRREKLELWSCAEQLLGVHWGFRGITHLHPQDSHVLSSGCSGDGAVFGFFGESGPVGNKSPRISACWGWAGDTQRPPWRQERQCSYFRMTRRRGERVKKVVILYNGKIVLQHSGKFTNGYFSQRQRGDSERC